MSDKLLVYAIDRPELAPFAMPDRFRREIVYFMSTPDQPGAPAIAKNEYWIETENVSRWLDNGFFTLVSPLDAESVAEIELTDEHEQWLEWLIKNNIHKVRIG